MKHPLNLTFIIISLLSSCKQIIIKNQSELDSVKSNTNAIRNIHFDSLLLISSGQISPYKNIKIDNAIFQIVKSSDGDTVYLGTSDISFITPEGYKVGMELKAIKQKFSAKIFEEPGWGYYIQLPSKWKLRFIEGDTTTDHPPTDTSKVESIFKRN
jgi:hypothetical protein